MFIQLYFFTSVANVSGPTSLLYLPSKKSGLAGIMCTPSRDRLTLRLDNSAEVQRIFVNSRHCSSAGILSSFTWYYRYIINAGSYSIIDCNCVGECTVIKHTAYFPKCNCIPYKSSSLFNNWFYSTIHSYTRKYHFLMFRLKLIPWDNCTYFNIGCGGCYYAVVWESGSVAGSICLVVRYPSQ